MELDNPTIKSYIAKAYKEIGMIPINGQDSIVERIITDFFINKKRNVILSADTGLGKSIIGAIVAKVFSYVFEPDENSEDKVHPSMIVVHSNSLVKQYGDTFNKFKPTEFHQIIGANNYHCEAATALSKENVVCNAEDCFESIADEQIKKKYCGDCEFKRAKSYINNTDCLITNYSYHFISRMVSNHVAKRKLMVFDEAHNINEVFCDHNSVKVSKENLEKYIDETKVNFGVETKVHRKTLRDVRDQLENKEIRESNYVNSLKNLMVAYRGISRIFKDKNTDKSDIEKYMKLNRISKKYDDLASKISDLFNFKYDHAFDGYDPENKNHYGDKYPREFTIKPIFVDKMANKIMSDYNLFMSATISDEFMLITMGLDPNETSFIKLPPVYDPENKTILFSGNNKLNFTSMKNPDVLKDLNETVKAVLDDAHEDEYKGLILTPSFDVGEMIAANVPNHTKVFLHKRGTKVDPLIKQFKDYKYGSAVLISPSIYEGLSFDDDYSRFQIIVKCPFPSLGDKRMKYIASNYPKVYRIMTLMKIIQGIGRSVRNKDDWGITVICDKNAEELFNSNLNVWKDQFHVV